MRVWDCGPFFPSFFYRVFRTHMKGALPLLAILLGIQADASVLPFLEAHCYECHADGVDKGGLDFDKLSHDLNDEATFAIWERVYERVLNGEMPPEKVKTRPTQAEVSVFKDAMYPALASAHTKRKGTVLRRLNRREYQNTMNDLFGTNLDLEGMLPEDGRSHEFDNVGASLGVSMTHLQKYLDAAALVFDTAMETASAKGPQIKVGGFRDDDIKNHSGKSMLQLPDGAIVRFQGGGYPSGLLRTSDVPKEGLYKVRITGYAYQSEKPLTISVRGESYQQGSAKPLYGYHSFPPGKPTTIEFEQWIMSRYMLVVEPENITKPRNVDINEYKGPGFAFLKAELEGPLTTDAQKAGYKLIFQGLDRKEIPPRNPADLQKHWYKPKFEIVSSDEAADFAKAISRLAAYAFRRAASMDEIAPYLQLFASERSKGETFEQSYRTVICALFSSPNFLYLNEPGDRLDDFAIANRLSYFLNRTIPDKTLLSLAYQKQLTSNPKALQEQAERLLQSSKFQRFLTDFTESWLNLREMDFTIPDSALYPEFDQYLHQSMPMETESFLRELIYQNLPVTHLVKPGFAMLNERLAEHYGIDGVVGPKIRKVTLPPDSLRGGFLSQGSILKVSANGTNTSPVLRGIWVLERILAEPPPPPPPGVPGVEPDIRGARTLRQLLEKHRDSQSCRSCHAKIDPPGFALEVFNPIGGYRDFYRSLDNKAPRFDGVQNVRYRKGPPVDASGSFPDGAAFHSFNDFRDLLANQPDRLSRALSTKLLTFATGRELGFSDRPEIERIVQESAKTNHGIRHLLHLCIQSQIFQTP
jgi:hypothetical protein